MRNQLLSSSVASFVATAEARFFGVGKGNGAFCAETDRKAAQRAVPVGEPGEPYGHQEQGCTQVRERQKTPDDAANVEQAGFDG
ncbi:MAG: hypothetical protein ACLU98_05600 [Desulfovibrio fairfieldensis]